MEREDMSEETQTVRIILTLEQCVREINSILHQANEPKMGGNKQSGNQLSTRILIMFKAVKITSESFCTFSDKE